MKVVFILGSTNDSHVKNRIDEFLCNGIDVDVYGYDRKGRNRYETNKYVIHTLGEIADSSYFPRFRKYVSDIRRIKKIYKNEKVVFFIHTLDIAIVFRLLYPRANYIYEEADLTHTYRKGEKLLERLDIWVIRKSLITILTSEGFVQYHFGATIPNNVVVIPNKLNPEIQQMPHINKREFNQSNIHFGFVGKPRFQSIYNFIDVVCSSFPNSEVDIFGGPIEEEFEELKKHPNCHFHGFFKNPDDLPQIYSSIDFLISAYDYRIGNVKHAEPNKLYEAIYFETPIIVSTGTFLANKVSALGVGYVVDPFNKNSIVGFVDSISAEKISQCITNIKKIDKCDTLNVNNEFFVRLKRVL